MQAFTTSCYRDDGTVVLVTEQTAHWQATQKVQTALHIVNDEVKRERAGRSVGWYGQRRCVSHVLNDDVQKTQLVVVPAT